MDLGYAPCCPNCGYLLAHSAKFRPTNKRVLSISCPRLSHFFKRKISGIRKNVTRNKDPVICDGCQRKVRRKYVEQNLCVRPLFSYREPPYRTANTSLHRNLMHVLYGTPFKDFILDPISSDELITDMESERFVSSTEYTAKKIEDDLKEKLLEECFSPKNVRPMNFTRLRGSSNKLRMLFLNEARDNSLQRTSSHFGPAVSLESRTHMSPSETTVTQTCYDGSWKHGPKTCPFNRLTLPTDDLNPKETPNKDIMAKKSTFTHSKSKITEIMNPNARRQLHMETQYSLRSMKAIKKKKKRKSHSVVRKESLRETIYEGDMLEQSYLPDPWKERRLNSKKRPRKNWMLVQNPKTLREIGVSTMLKGLHTMLENTPKAWLPPEGVRQQVMYINPSRNMLMKGCLFITRENIETQCNMIIAEPKPIIAAVPCKSHPKILCEKGCQYSEHNISFVPPYTLKPGVTNQNDHRTIFQCHQRPASKFIQSPCSHNPPCELVPSCFQAKCQYIVNYCLQAYLRGNDSVEDMCVGVKS